MRKLFFEGGPIYMGILTGILIIMVAWALYHFLPALLKKESNSKNLRARLKHIKTIGTFGLVFGIMSQLIGLYQAFSAVEQMGGVSPALLMGGLKVSMITTFYGIIIYLISLLTWFITDHVFNKMRQMN